MKNIRYYYTAIIIGALTLSACNLPQNNTTNQQALLSDEDKTAVADKNNSVLKQPLVDSKQAEAEKSEYSRLNSPMSSGKRKQPKRMINKSVYQAEYLVQPLPQVGSDNENYAHLDQNSIVRVSDHPLSTFSIDVDTGSYSNMRRLIQSGNLPRKDMIRVEELVNYFSYHYPQPKNNNPFSVNTEIATTPWNKNTYLLHIGIKGLDVAKHQLPASNLVFLVDVSGSMNTANKLSLLKTSLKLLSKRLRKQDKISLVVYAGASGVVLQASDGNQTRKINRALDNLTAGGSTNGGAGIKLAYDIAQQAFIKNGINRVILATDGDFNVGTVNFDALTDLIEQKRKTGISLTTLGFGTGNYNDHLMEQLADKGNGNYHYIDTLNEAQKVLVDEMSSTLQTIAKDVKIQIEFNQHYVAEYRLIGYENRKLKREDFNNDKIDAGEIGAGHTVTALYEISLVGDNGQSVDPLRYQKNQQHNSKTTLNTGELAFLKIRYKAPQKNTSQLLSWPLKIDSIIKNTSNTSDRYRFSAAVAAFAQLLKGGLYTQQYSYDDVLNLARQARGEDNFGYRAEFIKLVNLTKSLG